MSLKPGVSVGLAVFNGENYLAEAIESILAQTYREFEIIISDNASTDATQQICSTYVKRDTRVRYFRQKSNRGAAWNQNEVIRLAEREYFKLAAHDDLIDPEFLQHCVTELENHKDIILAYTDTYEMPKGNTSYLLRWHDKDTLDTANHSVSTRFSELIRGDQYGFRIFGVIRTGVLRKTRLFGAFHASDHILMTELGLLGRFTRIDKPLFLSRLHPGQSIHLSFEPRSYVEWWGGKPSRFVFPTWRYLKEMILAVRHIDNPVLVKLMCFAHILGWSRRKWRLLAVEIFKLRPQTPVWDKPK